MSGGRPRPMLSGFRGAPRPILRYASSRCTSAHTDVVGKSGNGMPAVNACLVSLRRMRMFGLLLTCDNGRTVWGRPRTSTRMLRVQVSEFTLQR